MIKLIIYILLVNVPDSGSIVALNPVYSETYQTLEDAAIAVYQKKNESGFKLYRVTFIYDWDMLGKGFYVQYNSKHKQIIEEIAIPEVILAEGK